MSENKIRISNAVIESAQQIATQCGMRNSRGGYSPRKAIEAVYDRYHQFFPADIGDGNKCTIATYSELVEEVGITKARKILKLLKIELIPTAEELERMRAAIAASSGLGSK